MTGHDQAADALLRRVLGPRAVDVDARVVPDQPGFSLEATGGQVRITGESPVAVAAGLRHYLVSACEVQFTWDDHELDLPQRWPDSPAVSRTSAWQHRYYLNYCTFGYTTAFWDWERWEQEIDWMAVHGITMPLCTVGYESVWLNVLTRHGMATEDVLSYLGSPAFLPWLWMGCTHDHGMAMTTAWIEQHRRLGRRILDRQRELGMHPVLPAFAGFVPDQLADDQTHTVDWFGITNHQLPPTDPRFAQLGAELLAEQERQFGTGRHFALDPFIEGRPPYEGPDDVAQMARALSTMLTDHRQDAVWVFQAWPFSYRKDYWSPDHVRAFLDAVPQGRMLVLDLWADHRSLAAQTEHFAGHDWVWCMLHTLGGRPGLHGALERLTHDPSSSSGSITGLGLSMEALDRDPVLYELFADVVWQEGDVDLDAWLRSYIRARYGGADDRFVQAWQILARTAYAREDVSGPPRSLLLCRPNLREGLEPLRLSNASGDFPSAPYTADLQRAWRLLLEGAEDRRVTAGLARDLVDLGQDVLSGHAYQQFELARDAVRDADVPAFDRASAALLALVDDAADLAATSRHLLLGPWLAQARAWGQDEDEGAAYAREIKRLFTTWVRPGHRLQDYAGRHAAELIRDYYRHRWAAWVDQARLLAAGEQVQAGDFEDRLARGAQAWLDDDHRYPTKPSGSVLETARKIAERLPRARREVGGAVSVSGRDA